MLVKPYHQSSRGLAGGFLRLPQTCDKNAPMVKRRIEGTRRVKKECARVERMENQEERMSGAGWESSGHTTRRPDDPEPVA